MALEAAEDPSDQLQTSLGALQQASVAEEYFAEAERRVRCFDEAAALLEQAEIRVQEAQTAVNAGAVSTASRAAFRDALREYESVLSITVASSEGADAFLEACNSAFAAAREVERASARARRRVRARTDRRRRELARLDRPAAALVALDLSELTEAGGEGPARAVTAVRDALSAIGAAREEVAEGPHEREEEDEAALAGRVEAAVQAAAGAERAFREAREMARRARRWQQELARPGAALARLRNDVLALPDAELVAVLCTPSFRDAERALAVAREGVAAFGRGDGVGGDAETLVEEATGKVRMAQRDAEEQVRTSLLYFFSAGWTFSVSQRGLHHG